MNKQFLISAPLTDFAPLFGNTEKAFAELKETGIDGIELVIGLKSRWSVKQYQSLSKKYNLPILSLHQPIWSGLGIAFDEAFIEIALKLGASKITFHPLPQVSLSSDRMKRYFEHLASIKERTGLEMLIENLPRTVSKFYTRIVYPQHTIPSITDYTETAKQYGLNMTLDTDHLHEPAPDKQVWFKELFPIIRNIHLSSFTAHSTHLPLDLGEFDTLNFIRYLKKKKYSHLINLEIYYPSIFSFFSYNTDAIRRSVAIIKSIG